MIGTIELTKLVLDDGERVSNTLCGMGMAILATLNVLEQHSLLKPESPIPNIPLMLSLVFHWVHNFSSGMDDTAATRQGDWPNMIVAYAEKTGIEIKGLYNIKELLEKVGAYGTSELNDEDKNNVLSPPKPDKFKFVAKVSLHIFFGRNLSRQQIQKLTSSPPSSKSLPRCMGREARLAVGTMT